MFADDPNVVGCTPKPGSRWSTVLDVESIGTRDTADQFTPSAEFAYTISFEEQFVLKRQSDQAT